jgi:hypothetical protein
MLHYGAIGNNSEYLVSLRSSSSRWEPTPPENDSGPAHDTQRGVNQQHTVVWSELSLFCVKIDFTDEFFQLFEHRNNIVRAELSLGDLQPAWAAPLGIPSKVSMRAISTEKA